MLGTNEDTIRTATIYFYLNVGQCVRLEDTAVEKFGLYGPGRFIGADDVSVDFFEEN